ncbi:hypothetical protein F383_32158 [Gossypium arboreum]|uniref:Uncharacterized protein n=1 Tax=Gossypium arboreum TaxID=29729 RepID=A0A0B0PL24_GOSAR|nr:hypothetical protein F383_32158 [Gossypium arboreum]
MVTLVTCHLYPNLFLRFKRDFLLIETVKLVHTINHTVHAILKHLNTIILKLI